MDRLIEKAERPTADHYMRLLDDFGAHDKRPRECVKYLEERGYSHGQARNAVYRYRRARHVVNAREK